MSFSVSPRTNTHRDGRRAEMLPARDRSAQTPRGEKSVPTVWIFWKADVRINLVKCSESDAQNLLFSSAAAAACYSHFFRLSMTLRPGYRRMAPCFPPSWHQGQKHRHFSGISCSDLRSDDAHKPQHKSNNLLSLLGCCSFTDCSSKQTFTVNETQVGPARRHRRAAHANEILNK